MNTVSTLPYSVSRLPAFNDNYLWLIDDGCRAITVETGDAEVVKNALIERGLQLVRATTFGHELVPLSARGHHLDVSSQRRTCLRRIPEE